MSVPPPVPLREVFGADRDFWVRLADFIDEASTRVRATLAQSEALLTIYD